LRHQRCSVDASGAPPDQAAAIGAGRTDLNGDGRVDVVVGPDDNGAWWGVQSDASPTDLMVNIYNGYNDRLFAL
jgi:hypothetical protein